MVFKRASELNEFLQIHQLNYKTFVEEIPQHQQNAERMLVDKFHDKNHYIVAKRGENVIGMVCYNLERPFSVEGKIKNFESYLPKYNRLAEVRLLSVSSEERKTGVFYSLMKYLCHELIQEGTDAAVISGTTRQSMASRNRR